MNAEQRARKLELLAELDVYQEALGAISLIQNEIRKLYASCKHEDAYIIGYSRDNYDERSYEYEDILCPDCGKPWHERMGHSNLPTWEEKNKGEE